MANTESSYESSLPPGGTNITSFDSMISTFFTFYFFFFKFNFLFTFYSFYSYWILKGDGYIIKKIFLALTITLVLIIL